MSYGESDDEGRACFAWPLCIALALVAVCVVLALAGCIVLAAGPVTLNREASVTGVEVTPEASEAKPAAGPPRERKP